MAQSWINYQESKYKPYSCSKEPILDAQNKAVNSNLYSVLLIFCIKGTEHAKVKIETAELTLREQRRGLTGLK